MRQEMLQGLWVFFFFFCVFSSPPFGLSITIFLWGGEVTFSCHEIFQNDIFLWFTTAWMEDHSQICRIKHNWEQSCPGFLPYHQTNPSVSSVRTVHCVKITYNYLARKEDRVGPGDFRTLKEGSNWLVSGDSWNCTIAPLSRSPTTDLSGNLQFWTSFSSALSEIAETEVFGFN